MIDLVSERVISVATNMREGSFVQNINAAEMKLRQDYEKYDALYGRIKFTHKEQRLIPLADLMLLLLFSVELLFDWINAKDYFEYCYLLLLPGSSICGNRRAQIKVGDEFSCRQELNAEVKAKYTVLSLPQVKDLILLRTLPSAA